MIFGSFTSHSASAYSPYLWPVLKLLSYIAAFLKTIYRPP